MTSCTGIRVVGIHPVVPTREEFNTVIQIQYGDDLVGEALENAEHAVRRHFAGLYLIEIEVEPHDCCMEWIAITQTIAGLPRKKWQVPWDERPTGNGHWAFFLHFVQLDKPLLTSIGPIQLPMPTPIPQRLANHEYILPG